MAGNRGVSSRSPGPQPYPWLMFTHGKSKKIQTFYNIIENRSLMRRLPDLSENNAYVSAGCEGWLVITQDNNACFLLNMMSMEKLLLPPLREDFVFQDCVLSSSPSSSNCTVVFVSTSPADDTKGCIMIWRPMQENWVEWELNVKLCYLTVCDGKIYALEDSSYSFTKYLVVLDIVGNDPPSVRRILNNNGPIAPPETMLIGTLYFRSYLVESCGDIFLVCQYLINPRRHRAIQVFKFDSKNSMEWVEVNDLGDNVFFIDTYKSNFSCSASQTGLQRNSIYFFGQNDTNDEKNMYWYNVAEDLLYRTLPCPNVVNNIQQRCWIMINP